MSGKLVDQYNSSRGIRLELAKQLIGSFSTRCRSAGHP